MARNREKVNNDTHFIISNAFFGIDNREMKSESGLSFAMASQPFYFFLLMSLYLFAGQTNFGKRVIKETCEAPENPHQEEEQIPFKEKIPE